MSQRYHVREDEALAVAIPRLVEALRQPLAPQALTRRSLGDEMKLCNRLVAHQLMTPQDQEVRRVPGRRQRTRGIEEAAVWMD